MITFDQIQLLEKKVSDAVQLIKKLKKENSEMKEELTLLEEMIAELESQKISLTSEPEVIEKGIFEALNQFDELDDGSGDDETAEEEITSETISASEDTEIAQPQVIFKEEASQEEESIEETIEVSLADESEDDKSSDEKSELEFSDDKAVSDESGNQSEQLEIESENSQDEAPVIEESLTAVESSFENTTESEEEIIKKPASIKSEEDKNSGYPQNLEIF
jgi:hypothetical protein